MNRINHNPAQNTRHETEALRTALVHKLAELCESFSYGKPNRQGSEYRFGTHGSLAVQISGPNAGQWFDHEAGEGGHVFEFINRHIGGSFKEAREWAINWLGGAVDYKAMKPRKRPVIAEDKNPYRDAARSIWNDAEPLKGTIGETYLRRRAINVLPIGDVARFVPSLNGKAYICLLYTSPSPRDKRQSRMPSSA